MIQIHICTTAFDGTHSHLHTNNATATVHTNTGGEHRAFIATIYPTFYNSSDKLQRSKIVFGKFLTRLGEA